MSTVRRLTALASVAAAALPVTPCPGSAQQQNSDAERTERFVTEAGDTVRTRVGSVRLPENHRRPSDDSIRLRYERYPATEPDPGPPFIYLAGGPGNSGIEIARGRYELIRRLRRHGDVIAFDQRGTGRSDPNLTCPEPVAFPFGTAPERAELLEAYHETARGCADHWRSRGVDLPAYTTRQSADDIDALRARVGADSMRLVGMSYGTHLGLTTIRRHGSRVSAAVLAGVEGPDHTYKLPETFDRQLRRLDSAVAQSAWSQRVDDFQALVRRVHSRLSQRPRRLPLPGSGGDSIAIGRFDMQLLTRIGIGRWRTIRFLPAAYWALDHGRTQLAASILAPFAANLRRDTLSAMAHAMDCASGASRSRLNRIRDQGRRSLLDQAVNFPFPDVCRSWGIERLPREFRSPIRSDVPVLFISGSWDAFTPPENARNVLEGFPNGEHLLVEGVGHSTRLFLGSPDILQAIDAFLEQGDLPSDTVRVEPPEFLVPGG